MNILFIGGYFPRKIRETIVQDTNGKIGFSNHNFEKSLITGIFHQPNVNLKVISSPKVYSFPMNNRRLVIKKDTYSENGIQISSIGFLNLFIVNKLSIIFSLVRKIISELRKFQSGDTYIIVNTPTLEYLVAVFLTSIIYKKYRRTLLIIPDVPECLSEMAGVKDIKNKIISQFNRFNNYLCRKFDKFVFLTKAMNDYYRVEEDRFIVMEGMINEKIIDEKEGIDFSNNYEDDEKEIIMYTGSLKKIFGIIDLIEIFEQGKFDNCELWICGSGETTDLIKQKARENNKIRFFGLVTSEKALELQNKATILVNPRNSSMNYTKYSFPSKTLEYLISGKSVITNKLPGIPSEYDEYLFYPEDETKEAWINKIRCVISMRKDKRNKIGAKSRDFILKNKTSRVQCSRIIRFLSITK